MNMGEEMDEDELMEYMLQLSIQEHHEDLCLACTESTEMLSGEKLKIFDAIAQGEVESLQGLPKSHSAFREVDSRGWLPLHRAAVQPVAEVLKAVLHASLCRLSLEDKTLEGETALTLAVQAGLLGNTKVLLENGVSPHTTNSNGESPLLLAVRNRSLEMVSTLIKSGARAEQICRKGWTAVHEAARLGSAPILVLLLRNAGSVSDRDCHGVTALGVAAEHAQVEVLELLIHYGANVNEQDNNGESILMDAAGSGSPDCVDLLLQHGADPNLPSLTGHLPVHRAAYEGHYLAFEILIPVTSRKAIRQSGQSPVHSAADGGHAQCLALLAENGFDINVTLEKHISENYGDMRRSALYFAVSHGDAVCTELLLNAGANPNRDPLHCLLVAVRAGMYEIVRLLLAKQADVNCYFRVISDTLFPTALQYCLRDEVMMHLLLNGGYDAERCFSCNHDNSFLTHCPWKDLKSQMCEMYNQEDKIPFCDFITVSCLKHLAGTMVRVLLDYVGHVPICSKLKLTLEKQKEWPEICAILGNPRPLKHLCRLAIRRRMTAKTLCDISAIKSVPLAPRIRDYLLYQEYDLYGQNIVMNM